jgi:hypothetical protein
MSERKSQTTYQGRTAGMDTFFERRRDALLNTLTEMERYYGAFPAEPQLPTLCATTKRLKDFTSGILTFFDAGFAQQKLAWDGYPPNNVFSVLLDQIAFDMEVIRRAADQRITSGSMALKQRLKEADNLAWQTLQPAVGDSKPLEPGTTVVTYFQKSPMARVIPYANVALIGIPFTSVDETRDLLATPHEVGHYFFWRARDVVPPPEPPLTGEAHYFYRTVIKQAVDELKALITLGHPEFDCWCHSWLEELFADAYGCWTAGPVSALTLQDIQANRAASEFVESDGDHPAPVLRPYTAWKVLAARLVDPAVLSLLKSRWQEILASYGNPNTFRRPDGSDLTVREAVETDSVVNVSRPVDRLVNLIINRLKTFGLPTADWYSRAGQAPATAAELYAQFESYRQGNLAGLQVVSQPEAQLSGPADFNEWAKQRFDSLPDLAALIDDPNYSVEKAIPEADWLPILQARGWTTEGPQDRWP